MNIQLEYATVDCYLMYLRSVCVCACVLLALFDASQYQISLQFTRPFNGFYVTFGIVFREIFIRRNVSTTVTMSLTINIITVVTLCS